MELLKPYYRKGFGTIIPIAIKEYQNLKYILYIDIDDGGNSDLGYCGVVSLSIFKSVRRKNNFDAVKSFVVHRIFESEWMEHSRVVFENWSKL